MPYLEKLFWSNNKNGCLGALAFGFTSGHISPPKDFYNQLKTNANSSCKAQETRNLGKNCHVSSIEFDLKKIEKKKRPIIEVDMSD